MRGEIVGEGGSALLEEIEDFATAAAESFEIGERCLGAEPGEIVANEEGDGDDASEGGHRAAALGVAFGGEEASPSDGSLKTEFVELTRSVGIHAGGDEIGFPGHRGKVESLKLGDDFEETILAGLVAEVMEAVMLEKELLVGGDIDGLDLSAEAVHREAVDSGEEATVTPFEFGFGGGFCFRLQFRRRLFVFGMSLWFPVLLGTAGRGETAAQNDPFAFEGFE